jgi:hypothetical protein
MSDYGVGSFLYKALSLVHRSFALILAAAFIAHVLFSPFQVLA